MNIAEVIADSRPETTGQTDGANHLKPAAVARPTMRTMLVMFALLALPLAYGETPQEVLDYCVGLDASGCAAKSSWHLIDGCRSMVRCMAIMDPETFSFQGCRTALKDIFDDCDDHPSTLCYNGIAYDTSRSETCTSGEGARLRLVDSCGNPKGLGACLKLSTCEEVTVRPYQGTTITMHEGCEVADDEDAAIAAGQEDAAALPVQGTSPSSTRDEEDGDDEDDEPAAMTAPSPTEPAPTKIMTPPDAAAEPSAAQDGTPTSARARLESKSKLPALGIAIGAVAIGFLIYWLLRRR
jgi:hypothetical protein